MSSNTKQNTDSAKQNKSNKNDLQNEDVEVESRGVGPDEEEEDEQKQNGEQEQDDEENDKVQKDGYGNNDNEEDEEENEGQDDIDIDKQDETDEQQQHQKKCLRCEKNKQSIQEQDQAAERLKQQNDKLNKDLEELRVILEEAVQKSKEKEKQAKKIDPEERKLQKEIDEVNNKFNDYKEKIKSLQQKIDNDSNYEKALKIQNDQRLIEQEIENYKAMNRQIDRDRRDNEYAIQLRNAEFVQAKRLLEDELKKQKQIYLNVRNGNRDSKISMLVQQEHLVRLEEQHRSVCETYGASFSMIQTRIDRMSDLIQANHKRRLEKYEQEEAKKEKFDITPENYKNFRKEIFDLMTEKKKQIAENEETLGNINAKIQFSQRELELKRQKLKEKDHEINIALMKINDLKRNTKHNQLQPIQLESRYDRGRNMLAVKSQQDLRYLKKKANLEEQSFVKGGVMFVQEGAVKINHADELPAEKDYKISAIQFFYLEDMILGMMVQYTKSNNEQVVIDSFMPQQMQIESLQQLTIELTGTEYISVIKGYASKEQITWMEIITSRARQFQVGSDKSYLKCRRFEIEIKKDQKPIAFQLVIDSSHKKSQGEKNVLLEEKLLVNIGFECKKKDIGFNAKSLHSAYLVDNLKNSRLDTSQINSEKNQQEHPQEDQMIEQEIHDQHDKQDNDPQEVQSKAQKSPQQSPRTGRSNNNQNSDRPIENNKSQLDNEKKAENSPKQNSPTNK